MLNIVSYSFIFVQQFLCFILVLFSFQHLLVYYLLIVEYYFFFFLILSLQLFDLSLKILRLSIQMIHKLLLLAHLPLH